VDAQTCLATKASFNYFLHVHLEINSIFILKLSLTPVLLECWPVCPPFDLTAKLRAQGSKNLQIIDSGAICHSERTEGPSVYHE
jgi:hypothetical protein